MAKRDKTDDSNIPSKGSESGSASGRKPKSSKKVPKVSRSIDADTELMAAPEDPKFQYPRAFSVKNIGFDSRFVLVHGFWVSSTKAANYRRIVEKFGHMCVHEGMHPGVLVVTNEDLIDIADSLSHAEDTPIDPELLKKWDSLIQTYLLLQFPIQWLKDLLDGVKATHTARHVLPQEIEELDREYRRLINVSNIKKEVYDKLMTDIAQAGKDFMVARTAVEEVNSRLVQKRVELAFLD